MRRSFARCNPSAAIGACPVIMPTKPLAAFLAKAALSFRIKGTIVVASRVSAGWQAASLASLNDLK